MNAIISIVKGAVFGLGSVIGDIAMKTVVSMASEKFVAKWLFKLMEQAAKSTENKWDDQFVQDAKKAYYEGRKEA